MSPDRRQQLVNFNQGERIMYSLLQRSSLVRGLTLAVVVAAAAVVPAHARQTERATTHSKWQPIVFTVDVAEDLSGKFVPTFVKPEHT
ncbi:MAG: hypothetical protein ACRD1U_03720, partial [Vicinamibacterales bacterium]